MKEYVRTLDSEEDFEWYKKEIDVAHRYSYSHYGQPREYPCLVKSNISVSDCYDNDRYYHEFKYKIESICSECKHKSLVWQNEWESGEKD